MVDDEALVRPSVAPTDLDSSTVADIDESDTTSSRCSSFPVTGLPNGDADSQGVPDLPLSLDAALRISGEERPAPASNMDLLTLDTLEPFEV